MVTRVVGEVNGTTVIFNVDERGAWTATVPTHVDGEWIVSLFAYDDAGNRSFFIVQGDALGRSVSKGFSGQMPESGVEAFWPPA